LTRARSLLLAPFVLAGCLPEDTRPPPAEVTMTAAGSAFTTGSAGGALSADGFSISVRRFLVSIGQAELRDGTGADSSCNVYSTPSYTRVLDFTQVSAPVELGIAYATGECWFGFRVRPPNDLDLLGSGVDASDDEFLRTPGQAPDSMRAGVSVYLEGEATRDGESWHFAWPFRKRVRYTGCVSTRVDANERGGLELASGDRLALGVVLRAEALFGGGGSTPPRFEPFTLADTDADGEITLDELWNVGVEDFATSGLYVPASAGAGGGPAGSACFDQAGEPVVVATLGDYAYCALLPKVAEFEGAGDCNAVVGRDPNAD
jgi:hypothetical protein